MEFIFVINPAAGKRDPSAQLIREIRRAFEGISHRPVIHLTTGTGDAALFCSQYCASHPQEELVFFACGGDGTLEEMVTGLDGVSKRRPGCDSQGQRKRLCPQFSRPWFLLCGSPAVRAHVGHGSD